MFATLGAIPALSLAHPPSGTKELSPTLTSAWSLSPHLLLPLALLLIAYALGLGRLWTRAGVGHGLSVAGVAGFAVGFLVLFLALVWPLDAYGEWSLAAHMAQHMLLLALAPPLLLCGRPHAVLAQALPRAWVRGLGRMTRAAPAAFTLALGPASLAHGAVMWIWHMPAALNLALAHDFVHWLMHLSFLGTGLWFWAVLWRRLREPQIGAGASLIALLAVMMQMGLLGALLTFAARPHYAHYVERSHEIGLDALSDQQLAGLLMWVPSCLPYLMGALMLVHHALSRHDAGSHAHRPD